MIGLRVCKLHFPAFLVWWLSVRFCQQKAQAGNQKVEHGKTILHSFTLCFWHPGERLPPSQSPRASCSSPCLVVLSSFFPSACGTPVVSLFLSLDSTTFALCSTSPRTGSRFLQLGISGLVLFSPFCSPGLQHLCKHFSKVNPIYLEFFNWFLFSSLKRGLIKVQIGTTLYCLQSHWNPVESCQSFHKERDITLKSISQPMNFKTPEHNSTPVEYCTCLSVTSVHHGNIRATRECVCDRERGEKKCGKHPHTIHTLWKTNFTSRHLF